MGVAIHETRDGDPPASVHGLAVRPRRHDAQHLSRRTDGRDAVTGDRDRGGGMDLELAEFLAPQRPGPFRRDRSLEVVDEERDLSHHSLA